ncbi:hypothetical protein Tco_0425954 [Tanacetum coccineum]
MKEWGLTICGFLMSHCHPMEPQVKELDPPPKQGVPDGGKVEMFTLRTLVDLGEIRLIRDLIDFRCYDLSKFFGVLRIFVVSYQGKIAKTMVKLTMPDFKVHVPTIPAEPEAIYSGKSTVSVVVLRYYVMEVLVKPEGVEDMKKNMLDKGERMLTLLRHLHIPGQLTYACQNHMVDCDIDDK